MQSTIPVTPGEVLNIYVGGKPTSHIGGWNGGGNGGGPSNSGGGGGASDIRQGGTALANRIAIAGGGGGATHTCAAGGDGGGSGGGPAVAGDGWDCGTLGGPNAGNGGTQTGGGAGGVCCSPGSPGTLGTGGNGGVNASFQEGGGGGAGYYGGGGGGYRGGGGGSSFMIGTATGTVHTQGAQVGDGQIIINPIVSTGPAMPGTITGPSVVCAGSTAAYSISTVPTASTYTWTVPAGAMLAGQGNASVSVTFGSTSGTITVVATNSCGTSPSRTMAITVNPSPAAPTAGSNSPLCEGTTLYLTASTVAGATYTWTGPNFTSTSQNPSIPNVTSNEAGTYSVTVTVGGCISPAGTTAVTVNPSPTVPSAGSNSPLCEGTTLYLTASTVAGATYTWTGPFSFSSNNQNPSIPNVTTDHAGTYSVTVMMNGCTSPAGTTTVIVNTAMNPVISASGPTTFCDGGNVELVASGSDYQWSTGATTQSIWVSESGTYFVTSNDANGCIGTSAGLTVTVNPNPAVTFTGLNPNYCLANPVSALAGSPSGGTFTGPGVNGNSFDPAMSGVGNHTIIYAYADGNGCSGSTSQMTDVSANALVDLGNDTMVCSYSPSFILNAGTFPGYQWQDNSTNATFTVNPAALGIGTQLFYVNVTDANGCMGVDSVVVDVSPCLGQLETSGLHVNISPNPTEGVITITVNNFKNNFIEFRIMNSFGQIVLEKKLNAAAGYFAHTLDLSGLAKGIYYLDVNDGNTSGKYKIILR